jgi:hypothetical protein
MAMTKKQFKADCNEQTYTGVSGNKTKINALYFDYKEGQDKETGKSFRGYKYMVASNVKNISKAKLFDLFYDWVEKGTNLPYYVDSKIANHDVDRFRISLSISTR